MNIWPDWGYLTLTVLSVLLGDDLLEDVVGLGTHLHGLGKGRSAGREEHELLESQSVTGVLSAIDDVESRGGEDVRGLDTGEFGDVLVKRDALGDQYTFVHRKR